MEQLLHQYNVLDIIFIAILAISVIAGLIRGAVREILSIVGLALAIFMAFKFSQIISDQFVGKFIEAGQVSYIVSFILIIICVILAIALINLLIGQLLKASGLSYIDRILGMVFGGVRGALFCCIIVLVMGLIPAITGASWWKNSKMSPFFKQVAEISIKYLPDNIASYFDGKNGQDSLISWGDKSKETAQQAAEAIGKKMQETEGKIQNEQIHDILESTAEPEKSEIRKDPEPVFNTKDQQKIELESTSEDNTNH